MNPPTVFVTGANGLLGCHVTGQLLREGYRVKALARRPEEFPLGPQKNLSLVKGDLSAPESWASALAGCDAVIHIAALTGQGVPDYETYRQANVEATLDLLRSAELGKVRRFVYVSSANAFGYGDSERPGDESLPPMEPFTRSHYARSKTEAQRTLLKTNGPVEIVVVNPTFMIGTHDSKPGSGRIILMGYKKPVIFHPPGGKNFLPVHDAAAGVISAYRNGKDRECYLLAGQNLTYREFFDRLCGVTGQRSVRVKLPAGLLKFAGKIGDLLRKTGIPNEFGSVNMNMLCVRNYYTAAKAENELGFNASPIEEAIGEAIDWFVKAGKIRSV